jgi:hypothetical protein
MTMIVGLALFRERKKLEAAAWRRSFELDVEKWEQKCGSGGREVIGGLISVEGIG